MMKICYCCKAVGCDECHKVWGICENDIHICEFCKKAGCDVPKEWIPPCTTNKCDGYQLYMDLISTMNLKGE